jgi:hypothetical protein
VLSPQCDFSITVFSNEKQCTSAHEKQRTSAQEKQHTSAHEKQRASIQCDFVI